MPNPAMIRDYIYPRWIALQFSEIRSQNTHSNARIHSEIVYSLYLFHTCVLLFSKMQLLATLFFVGTASAHVSLVAGRPSAFLALRGIIERQVDFCEPVRAPYTCERSCGPGFFECIDFPTCYNPGRGETCCSDGC
jgi:hypothetical protein